MKRLACILIVIVLLSGCSAEDSGLDQAMALRAAILAGNGCTFTASITADYSDRVSTFRVDCLANEHGGITFKVLEPETIAGITGTLSAEGGKLTFDEEMLAFALLADGQVTPVSAPWLLIRTLRGGYVTSCGQDGELIRLSIDDSYEEDALHLDIWIDASNTPVRAEILWQDQRILSMTVENFEIV